MNRRASTSRSDSRPAACERRAFTSQSVRLDVERCEQREPLHGVVEHAVDDRHQRHVAERALCAPPERGERLIEIPQHLVGRQAAGGFGLAAYSTDGEAMRAVEATTIVWVLARLAFWIGYHRSAAMRGTGASSIALSLLVLIYVVGRIGFDVAGLAGTIAVISAFLVFEAFLFWATRPVGFPP
jgi:hypothetical protein